MGPKAVTVELGPNVTGDKNLPMSISRAHGDIHLDLEPAVRTNIWLPHVVSTNNVVRLIAGLNSLTTSYPGTCIPAA